MSENKSNKNNQMKSYNEIFEKNKEQKFYVLINSNMNLLLDPLQNTIFNEIIHLNNIHQKISVRTIMRFCRLNNNRATQQAIKTLRTIGIIGDKGYNLNLERIEEIYNQLNSIIKLDDKLAYCDSLLNGEEATNEAIETIQQEEEEVQEEEPIYNKVEEEEQEQPTIDIEEQPTIDITIQEPKEEEEVINNLNKEVMNNEEVTTTVQEPKEEEVQEHQQVPSKQELEKNAYVLINRMMQCDSKKDWADKQDKLFDYIAQNNTWTKEELNRITSALIEAKTMWEQEQYNKSMNLINAVQCGV